MREELVYCGNKRMSNSWLTIGVYAFISYLYLCLCWVVYIPNWYNYNESVLTLLSFCFITLCCILTFYNYYKAINTMPGSPPAEWKPLNASPNEMNDAIRIAQLYDRPPVNIGVELRKKNIRYCYKCSNFKPPRTHHCSECDRCILKMDHHCPWIDNCCGYRNHKYFILFLLYAIITQIYALMQYLFLIITWADKPKDIRVSAVIMVASSVMFILPELFGIVGLFIYQCYLISGNTTSIETIDKDLMQRDAKVEGRGFHYIYDLGTLQNLKETLGENIWTWLLPSDMSGNGTSYRINHKAAEYQAEIIEHCLTARAKILAQELVPVQCPFIDD